MKSFIIGISGGSGSGKTTLVHRLQQDFPKKTEVLYLDDYYKSLAPLPMEERARVNFDHPDALDGDLIARHLSALRRGECVESPVYDFARHDRQTKTRRVFPAPVILVDGVLLFALPQLRPLLDYRVFVDAGEEIRLQRRLRRDVQERGRTPESVRRQYRETVLPMFRQYVEPGKRMCSLLYPGDGENDREYARLCAVIREQEREIGES
ncbi:MAG: uridine kinase [Candidatus Heritagella sp.]